MQAHTLEELIQHLREYRSWGNQSEGYDATGMSHLLGACLDNLKENATKADLADVAECLEAHQVAFLKKLALSL
ncbi:MAG TPA: hypothetical protein VKW04_00485 [Planctomycetota bacterium]|nr:hypothetical protein [Planctomycetota bacterium]